MREAVDGIVAEAGIVPLFGTSPIDCAGSGWRSGSLLGIRERRDRRCIPRCRVEQGSKHFLAPPWPPSRILVQHLREEFGHRFGDGRLDEVRRGRAQRLVMRQDLEHAPSAHGRFPREQVVSHGSQVVHAGREWRRAVGGHRRLRFGCEVGHEMREVGEVAPRLRHKR